MGHNSTNNNVVYFFVSDLKIVYYNRDIGPAVRVLQWPGRPGFNPRSSHTKDFKNGT